MVDELRVKHTGACHVVVEEQANKRIEQTQCKEAEHRCATTPGPKRKRGGIDSIL
jgi:hypothetical protein